MSSLIHLTTDPPNAEVPLARLDGEPATQTGMYMRNNFPVPSTPPQGFTIILPGSGARSVTVEDLSHFEAVEDRIALECAGNGRRLMEPVPDGTPWGLGGASIIDVRGALLSDVLGDVPEAVLEIVATGADRGTVEPEGDVNYQFSMPRALALSEDPLLVTHIGGEPLTIEHGAPVRLIVRGHYAMMSVKWLERIEGITHAFDGHFVNKYRYYGDDSEPEGTRVGTIRPRSVVSSPVDGEAVSPGTTEVFGSAWTGNGEIEVVELSLNDGPWLEASLERLAPGIVRWSGRVELGPGRAVITARATDSTGASQPLTARWNENGYANNVCQRVEVSVA